MIEHNTFGKRQVDKNPDAGTFGYSIPDVELINYIISTQMNRKKLRKIYKFMHGVNLTCKNLRVDWKPKFRKELASVRYSGFCKTQLLHEKEKLLAKKWDTQLINLIDNCINQRYVDLHIDWNLYT